MLQIWNSPVVRTDSVNKTQGSNPTTSRFCRFLYSCKGPFSWNLSIFAHDMGNERSVLRFSSRVGAHLVFSKFALEENVIPHQWQVCGIFRHKNSLCNDDFNPVGTVHGTVGRFQIFLCLDSNRFLLRSLGCIWMEQDGMLDQWIEL